MAHFSDAQHIESCRGKNCNTMGNRTVMVKASRARNQPNARGWYCQACAERVMGTAPVMMWVDGKRVPIIRAT